MAWSLPAAITAANAALQSYAKDRRALLSTLEVIAAILSPLFDPGPI
jgi:hypothetical protein